MMPTWLRRHLEQTGRLDTDGCSRTIRAGHCPDCHTPTVRGLDSDICGMPVRCDTDVLDPVGELLAVAAGRITYDVTGPARRPQLDPRRPAHITGPRRYPVLAEHRCGHPLPTSNQPDPTPPASRWTSDEVPY
jgi:hypothetical protein